MKLRRREWTWLAVLALVLLAVRGMDARTTGLRRAAQRAAAAAAPAPGAPDPGVAAATAATGAAAGVAADATTLTGAELAAMPWGPSPFVRAARGEGGEPESRDGGIAAAPAPPALPRLHGVARVGGRLLAAVDGGFRGPGERIGDWEIVDVATDAVTVRNARTGQTRRLTRGAGEAQP